MIEERQCTVLLPQRSKPYLSQSLYDLVVDVAPGRWKLCARPDWSAGYKQYDSESVTRHYLSGLARRAGAFAVRAGIIARVEDVEDGLALYAITPKGAILIADEEVRRDAQRERQSLWNDHLRVCDRCRTRLPEEDQEWFVPPFASERALQEARQHAVPCNDGQFYERMIA